MNEIKAMHVIVKHDNPPTPIKLVDRDSKKFSSGYWHVGKDVAENMVGKKFYVHANQNDGSYHGGVVTDVIRHDSGRYMFCYVFNDNARDVKCKNWAQEKGYEY